MSKPKAIRPAETDPTIQLWHTLVDTLRLLPSVTMTARPPHPDPTQDLRAAQREKKTLDEAFEQVNNLIRLRKGDGVSVNGSTTGEPIVILPSPVVISTPAVNGNATSPAGGSGVKRKRDPRDSVSISPAPQLSAPPVETKTQSLPVPRMESGPKTAPVTTTAATAAGVKAGGVAMTPVNSSGPASLGVGLGINHGRSASPFAPPTRSGTPTSRQLTGRERKEAMSDHLPLLKGRRVLFKQPQGSKDKNEDGEEDAWILGTIVECIGGDKNRYRVQDADDTADLATYQTTLRSIIPLPDSSLPLTSPAHPSNIDDYPRNSIVLALYPETTSFYPAKVLDPPSRNKSEAGQKVYRVLFEGDDVPSRPVAAGDVVLAPPGSRPFNL